MASSKITKILSRPSIIILGLVLLSVAVTISGTPLPESDAERSLHESLNTAANNAKSFIDRARNTFTGKATDEKDGLTHWEIAGIVAAAVIILLIIPCCICYCLCECVKELICCICCCGACRD